MFTFVIWAIGIYIVFRLSIFNLIVVGLAFEHHWFLGLLAVSASLAGWILLLALIVG